MSQETIVITDCDLPGEPADRMLLEAGYRVVRPGSPDPRAIAEVAADAVGMVVQWATIAPEVMDELPRLQVISRLGIGYDMIDVAAATARGIAVTNTPTYCVEEVAAHTLAMIMSLSRGLPTYDATLRGGQWAPTAARPVAARPSATTVSIVGFGRIGELVARHCAALGFRVQVCDPFVDPGRIASAGLEPVDLAEAVASADLLSLHVPLTAETRHLINASTLSAMRPGAILINTCRGPLVDEQALVQSLCSGHTGAAALDVFAVEPLPADSALREAPNLTLSPHAAWYSAQALADLPAEAAQNVSDFLAGRELTSIVNPDFAAAAAGRW